MRTEETGTQDERVNEGEPGRDLPDDPLVLADQAEVGQKKLSAVLDEPLPVGRVVADGQDVVAALDIGTGECLPQTGGAARDDDVLHALSPCDRDLRVKVSPAARTRAAVMTYMATDIAEP